jgi:hypothetical protein
MEEWNGSSWTNLTALPEKRGYTHANGPETAFFMASGALGDNAGAPYTNATLNYDGSSISTGENVNTARSAGGAAGDSANAIFYGGDISGTSQTKTEKYDGTSWSEVADMAVAKRGSGAGAGTSNAAALSAGAYGPPASASTEEFTSSTNTITAAAWTSGGAYPAAFQGGIGFGLQTAAVGAGGTPSPTFNLKTFEYDGSSWTAGNDMARASGSPYTSAYSSGSGTQTSGWAAGGGYPTPNALTENYNGTNWTASAAMPANRRGGNCSGPQTAGLFFGGFAPPQVTTTYEYDGEGWTTGGAMGTARSNAGGSHVNASQTAGLAFTGNSPSQTSNVEEYNGTAWSEVNNYPISVSYVGYAGTQTDAIGFMGYTSPGPSFVTTFGYDGTSWSTRPNASTSRLNYHNNAGTATAALVFGGEGSSGNVSSTEEFTGKTETANIADFTTS